MTFDFMKYPNRNYIILKIIDFNVHPNELTQKLDIKPTRTAIKGDKKYLKHIPGSRNQYDEAGPFTTWLWNYWEYEIYWNDNNNMIAEFDMFVENILKPKVEIIAELSKKCDIILSIVQYYYNNFNPGFSFNNNTLHTIHQSGASLDIDVYCASE